MALADDLMVLRERVLTELVSAHDYYTDTRIAWRLVYRVVAAGNAITIRNTTTGTVTTQFDLTARSRGYVAEQLAEATFQQFVSLFESFLFDFLRHWLTEYPQSLGKKTVDFKTVLELPDKDAVAQLVVGRELNEVLYDRPAGWFNYLEDKVKLGRPSANEIERIAEIKASRDALVHNRGIANRTYLSKAGSLARFREGNKIDIPEHYHRETWVLIRKIVSDISDAAIAKAL